MSSCLFCYQPLASSEQDFHSKCSKKMFGQDTPPIMPYSEQDLEALAKEILQSQTVLTGVQAKLSLHLKKLTKKAFRLNLPSSGCGVDIY